MFNETVFDVPVEDVSFAFFGDFGEGNVEFGPGLVFGCEADGVDFFVDAFP